MGTVLRDIEYGNADRIILSALFNVGVVLIIISVNRSLDELRGVKPRDHRQELIERIEKVKQFETELKDMIEVRKSQTQEIADIFEALKQAQRKDKHEKEA